MLYLNKKAENEKKVAEQTMEMISVGITMNTILIAIVTGSF